MFRKKSMEELQRLSPADAQSSVKFPIRLILDDVRSMQNVGAAFRSADAFGIEAMDLCGITPCPPHRDIHKTALGATESVAWNYHQNITQLLQKLKAEGYVIAAVEQVHDSEPLYNFKAPQKLALVFGNEVNGVSEAALALCDTSLEIPQAGSKHSLNIAVSVGVVLWEVLRERL